MRKILLTLLILAGGLGTIAAIFSGHMMEDQRRHIAYQWLLISIPLTLLGAIPQIVEVWRKSHPDKDPETRPRKPDYRLKFGAYWDSDLNPYCPVCLSPLVLSTNNLMYWIGPDLPPPNPEPHCLKCEKARILHDDDGKRITLAEAKQLLSPIKRKGIDPPKKPYTPSLERTPAPQAPKSDVYEPDEMAIQILIKIKWGVAYESEIANTLNIDPKQIRKSLALLEQYGYIALQRSSERAPFYMLTDKGDALINKPDYKGIPHPSAYRPDPLSTQILKRLADADADKDAKSVAASLNIHPEKARLLLNQLEQRGYVYEQLYLFGRSSEYYLTDKGREYLNEIGFFG